MIFNSYLAQIFEKEAELRPYVTTVIFLGTCMTLGKFILYELKILYALFYMNVCIDRNNAYDMLLSNFREGRF